MAKVLKDYFPIIRTRKEILEEIRANKELLAIYESWTEEGRESFLDFCTGVRGLEITYDGVSKAILNPEIHPERLESLISAILGRKVRIRQVLPNDSGRIAGETSLVIMDIVVELEDGSIGNVEIQRIGYAFPGQRCACYSSDLMLRQYKRVRAERKREFSYRDIKTVYTIVFLEKSTSEFKSLKNKYVHHSKQMFDSGLKMNLFQEFVFIPLDIFRESHQNKAIESEQEAWFTFLSCDSPEHIVELIEKYPMFRNMYEEVYDICLNMERVMHMFSKELLEMDRNTVRYMIEEQQEQLEEQQRLLAENQKKLDENNEKLTESQEKLTESQERLTESQEKLNKNEKELKEKSLELEKKEKENEELRMRLAALERELNKH